MRLLTPVKRTAIGIDVGSRAAKIAQASTRGGKIVRHSFATMNLSSDKLTTDTARQIASLLKRQGFTGREVVLAAPPQSVRMEAIELPKVVPTAMNQLAEMEIGRVTRLKNKSFEHGLWELPAPSRGGSASHVMTIALPHADADKLCQPFLDVGLDVIAIYSQVTAVAALVREILPPDDQLQTLIDIGADGTRLIILQHGEVLFHRAIPSVGTAAMESSLQTELGVPPDVADHILRNVGTTARNLEGFASVASRIRRIFEGTIESIASELQLTQNYITHRYQQQTAANLLLMGGGAAIPGFTDSLSVATGRQTMVVSPRLFGPPSPAANDTADRGESPAHLAALACALYAEDCR